MDAFLDIRDLFHVYPGGLRALDGLTLRIETGVFGLLGPNGAGKTTLMEILALRKRPTSGAVFFGDIDVLRRPGRIRPLLGFLPQEYEFFPRMTVEAALRLFGRLFALGGSALRRAVDEALERAHLVALARRRIGALSGGEKRRFGIAQAILNNPALLIVDEPTAGLDAEERLAFHNLLMELGQGRVVLLSTHIVRDVETVCDNLAVLNRGRIIFNGSVESLVGQADHETWEFDMEPGGIDQWTGDPRLISVRQGEENFVVRVVSKDKPARGARNVEPGLEDAYIRLVGTEGRRDD